MFNNSSPKDKYADFSKLIAFADDHLNAPQSIYFSFERVVTLMGKGEMLVTSIFFFFYNVFKGFFFLRVIKSRDCVIRD